MTFPEIVHLFIDLTTRFISPMAVATEWVIVAIIGLVIAFAPLGSDRRLRTFADAFHRLSNRKVLAILICGILPVVVRLSMLGFAPVPEPSIHDEFSHLLLADTFAHGRWTNPPHPMWEHFESIHIIQQPTYTSMYPPGQGAFLALGQVLFHEPWAGVLIGMGLMCATVCWMMQGWLPPAWAFFGTLVMILKFGVVGFWMNSYMGGAVPAMGGALLFGSLPRLRREDSRPLDGFLLGLGLIILMNSRPFEGAILGFAALLYLLPRFAGRMTRIFLPAGVVLSCGLLFTGYYSWKVTGSPVRMPYQVNRDTYGWPENLAFLSPRKVVQRHDVLRDMYKLELQRRDIYTDPVKFLGDMNTRLFDNWTFFIGPALTMPLILLPWVFRDRRTRVLILFLAIIAVLNLFQLVLYPYHLAPVAAVIFTIVAQGLRHIYVSLSRISSRRAIYFALLLPFCLILVGAMKQEAAYLDIPLAYWERAYEAQRDTRAYIEAWLSARSRKQLVIVRYAPGHSPSQEWVYNGADIDNGKVVWAREMDAESDAQLLAYFPDREAWLLEADVYPQRVVPYPQRETPDCPPMPCQSDGNQ